MNNPPGSGQTSSTGPLILRSISREMLLSYVLACYLLLGFILLHNLNVIFERSHVFGTPFSFEIIPLELIFQQFTCIWVREFRLKRTIDV